MAFVPCNFNRHEIEKNGKEHEIQGIRDVSVYAHYNTITDIISRKIFHSLLLNGGIKLLTRRYQYDHLINDEVGNPNFQLGTGSTDFIGNIDYAVRYKSWGLNYDFSYKMNTENPNEYHFGNRINTNLSTLYVIRI